MKAVVGVLVAAALSGCAPPPYQQYVMLFLNDPDSTQFRGSRQSTRDALVWCGEVNAKNRLGGMVGFTRYVLQMPEPELDANPARDPEGARLFSKLDFDGSDGFAAKWRLWCVG